MKIFRKIVVVINLASGIWDLASKYPKGDLL